MFVHVLTIPFIVIEKLFNNCNPRVDRKITSQTLSNKQKPYIVTLGAISRL